VRDGTSSTGTGSSFRPRLDDVKSSLQAGGIATERLTKLIASSWSEDPKSRPSCHHALSVIIKINPSKYVYVLQQCDFIYFMRDLHCRSLLIDSSHSAGCKLLRYYIRFVIFFVCFVGIIERKLRILAQVRWCTVH
jgi:hypothetical protein